MRASLTESWIVAITFGVLSIGSPRRRIAAVRVAATRSAPLRRSSVPVGSGMGRNCTLSPFVRLPQFAFLSWALAAAHSGKRFLEGCGDIGIGCEHCGCGHMRFAAEPTPDLICFRDREPSLSFDWYAGLCPMLRSCGADAKIGGDGRPAFECVGRFAAFRGFAWLGHGRLIYAKWESPRALSARAWCFESYLRL
jgi:hypothetical protein